MTNETTNTPPFKVKCIYIDLADYLTVGEEYNVAGVDEGFYKVKNDSGEFWWYCNNRFQIVETPKDKQEFSVGDNVVVNKISDGCMSYTDKNVKVSDNFKSYEYFYEWCHKQVGFGNDGWHLDN